MEVCLSGHHWIPSTKELNLRMGQSGEEYADRDICVYLARSLVHNRERSTKNSLKKCALTFTAHLEEKMYKF